MRYCTGAEHKVVTNENGGRWRGANGQTNLIFRHAGTRLLADGTQNAFSERLLGKAGGNAGVLKSNAAEPRLGCAPVD